jgi:hypothetical protein
VVTGQLEDSLRHDIESYIEGRFSSIKQEISELQNQLNDSLSRLMERQADVQMDGALAASVLEHLRAAHEKGVDLAASESSRAKASSDMALVKAAIEEIYAQHSQAEILKTLVNRAAAFAPRIAFFVIKGDQANGWRGRGFEGTVGDNAIQQISFTASADTVVGAVAKSKATWSGEPGSHTEGHLLLNKLGDEPPQRVVAIPLVIRDRVVAVLYADSAGLDSEAINLEALETLARVSSMAVELVSAHRAKHVTGGLTRPPQEAETTYTPTREYHEPTPAFAQHDSFTVDTVRPVSPSPVQPPQTESAERKSEPVAEQSFAEPAPVQSLPEPSFAATQSSSDTYAPDQSSVESHSTPLARRRYGLDAELPVSVTNDEERRLHHDARRFARLLVSEIKLYNEQKVIEGRSHGDLYDRLKEYIDRSREMYDKRVKSEVALRYDYFHNELVNTLGEGDAAKLGANYPGATVTA